MKTMTIFREDNLIIVDKRPIPVDVSDLDSSIHCIQWNEEKKQGHIEFVGGSVPNFSIQALGIYKVYYDRWEAKRDALDNPPPAKPLTPENYTSEQLKAYLAKKRYIVETGGTFFNGLPVHTDRIGQMHAGNLYAMARDGIWPEDGDVWKFKDGVPRIINSQQAMELSFAVVAHVQTCFAIEKEKQALIDQGLDPEIDNPETWPVNP
jgi:hypothetical protein